MDKAKIDHIAERLSHLHRKLKSLKKLHHKGALTFEVDAEITGEFTALQLELRATPKDDHHKLLFLKLCSDLQTLIVDYTTLKVALESMPPSQELPSPKEIKDIEVFAAEERRMDVEALERDLTQLREVALDLADLVEQQKPQIDEVERQVEVTVVETIKTEIELEAVTLTQAETYQRKYQWKKCVLCLVCCGLLLGAALSAVGALVMRK